MFERGLLIAPKLVRITHLEESPGRARAGNAECGADVVASIVLPHTLDLEHTFECNVMTTVCVVGEHELLRALLRPINRGLRVARCDALELCNAIDRHFHVLRCCTEHWQRCKGDTEQRY